MKYILWLLLCLYSLYSHAQEAGDNSAGPMQRVSTLAEMMVYNGPASGVWVADPKTGGVFSYTKERHTIDSGIVFPAYGKGYWVRQYDKSIPVRLSWFSPHMDSITDDQHALKMALRYPMVEIDGVIALGSKTAVPAGKIIEFAWNGAIVLLDTMPVKFDAFLKASDFQHIFRGTGKILLGTNSAAHVSVCWFGAKADCPGATSGKGTDNTTAFQDAIAAAQKVSDVFIPPSSGNMSYRITSTVTLTKKNHFFNFRFHGDGTSIGFTGNDRASNIFADMAEGSALNIQGSRRVYITDLSFRGRNTAPDKLGNWKLNTTATDSVDDPATFLSPGLKSSYAAITTDAEPYNKVWSADIVFQNLQIYNFSIGIGISQAGNLQGDRMRVERCQINYCTYGISIGNAQNRACHFKDVDMVRVWCGVTNTTFGNHSGSMFQVTGGQWCQMYRAFMIQPSYLGQCVISGLYTEALGCIGVIGNNNSNTSSVLFTGCNLSMRDDALHTGILYLPPLYTLWAYANVTFEGCNFYVPRHTLNMFAGSVTNGMNGSSITLTGCSILKCFQVHIKGNHIIDNTFFNPNADTVNYNRRIAVNNDVKHRYNTGYDPEYITSGIESNTADNSLIPNNIRVSRVIPRFYTVQDVQGEISCGELHHDTLSFTYSPRLQASFFRYVLPGDMIGTTIKKMEVTGYDNPVLRIISIDTGKRRVIASSFSNKLTFDKIVLYTNCFFVTTPMYGIFASGSNIITQTENTADLQPGDYITFSKASRAYRISSIDAQKKEIVLMSNIIDNFNGRAELYNELLTAPQPTVPEKEMK